MQAAPADAAVLSPYSFSMRIFKTFHYKALLLFFILEMSIPSVSFAQETDENAVEKLPVNKTDARGKKHGIWYFSKAARMGELGTVEFGNYDHGFRNGIWYKMDKNTEDLISTETYKKGILNGEVKYFDMGKLYCVGSYLALNPSQKYDTIVVTDPVTQDESYRVLSNESGAVRHGMWRYYDPDTGHLMKEEEYVADELVYKKDYETAANADSSKMKNYEKSLPHSKKGAYKPPPAKRSFTR